MRKLLFGIIPAILLFMGTSVVPQSDDIWQNRANLGHSLQEAIGNHYLVEKCQLKDGDKWLSIELKPATWRNPKDTKALVDSVESAVKRHRPLSLTEASMFKVCIVEPLSGLPVATVYSTGKFVNTDYAYQRSKEEKKTRVPDERPKRQTSSPIQYRRPIGAMWSGVKLYYGSGAQKTYVGKIVCFSGDDVLVEYPSGSQEWKSRKAIIDLHGQWFIDKNDPALKEMRYFECN